MKKIILTFLFLTFIIISRLSFAAYPKTLNKNTPSTTKWVFYHAGACLHSDHINHIAANGECLVLQTYFGKNIPNTNPTLLIFIHGDGIPGGGPSDYLKYIATRYSKDNVVPIVLIRPGYYDSYGNYSTGESYAFANQGYPVDSYRPHTIKTIAMAVKELKNFYHAKKVVLVGHSGGALMSGVILGKYPNIANAAVLASVVGNAQQWSNAHNYGSFKNSLSPNDFVKSIPKKDSVYIISGTNDVNTYPRMSKQYYNNLIKAGVNAHWLAVKGGTHNSVVLSNTEKLNYAIMQAIKN